ncbi:MAG TPA: hypothetical protein DEB09_03435 [Candidatus Magasanikbacteria bacterium]|nr:hypothetical protein [Candidatus Magasanikbacteria bacterium]
MDKKKIIYILAFIVIAGLLAFLIYRIFFYTKPETLIIGPDGTITTTGQTGLFPQSGEGKPSTTTSGTSGQKLPTAGTISPTSKRPGERTVEKTVDIPIISATKDISGNARFYNDVDGKFYRLNSDGKVESLSDEVFYNVKNVTWSPVNEDAIIEYPDGANIYYNFKTKEQVTLPKHWEDFSFSDTGDKIASKSVGLSPENQWIITANPDGKNIKLIEPMGENAAKVNVDWSPNKQIVATSRTGDALGADREEILMVGLNGENFKSIVVEGRGIQSQWSTEGKKLLYSVYSERSDFKPELWIVNSYGDKIGSGRSYLNLNTWAEKCTFQDERFVYCAVPTQLERGAGFAPALYDSTPDQIYRVDLQTGIKTEIPVSEDRTITNMFISSDGKTLQFTDENEGGLFSIDL